MTAHMIPWPLFGLTEVGMILPSSAPSARNAADNCAGPSIRFAQTRGTVTHGGVVADLPQGSGAPCPHRYPSPDGRRLADLRAPLLFQAKAIPCHFERQAAHIVHRGVAAFDAGRFLTLDDPCIPSDGQRGDRACSKHQKNNQRLYSSSSPSQLLRRAATPWSSRRRSAGSAASARPPFSMGTSPRAPSWGPQETWRIARPSRTAATDRPPALIRGQTRPSRFHPTIRAIRCGWSFSFQDRIQKGRPCSRRS